MPFEEKMTWVSVVAGTLVPAGYFAIVLPQLSDTAASEIAYHAPLVVSVIVTIVLLIVGAIAVAITTAIRAEATEPGSADDMDRTDERDVQISRRGDAVSSYVAATGIVVGLTITMLEFDYFWIANTLYLTLVAAGLVGGLVKLRSYRRGF